MIDEYCYLKFYSIQLSMFNDYYISLLNNLSVLPEH